MMVLNRKSASPARLLTGLALAFAVALFFLPAAAAPDDTERDLRGFDELMVRREKARRALEKGKTYLKDGSFDLARQSLSGALKLNEDLHEARFCLGLAEYRDGKFKLAAEQFVSLYERFPGYKNLKLELARSYLATGDCKLALNWLERHLKHSKTNKDTRELKRKIEKCSGKQEKRL